MDILLPRSYKHLHISEDIHSEFWEGWQQVFNKNQELKYNICNMSVRIAIHISMSEMKRKKEDTCLNNQKSATVQILSFKFNSGNETF